MQKSIRIFLEVDPPTATAQEKQVRVVGGRPMFYDKPAAREAKKLLTGALRRYAPEEPFRGPVELYVCWQFPKRKADRFGGTEWKYKDTKPDTDNLQKGLKDVMTRLGFWIDDAQVARETASKIWVDDGGDVGLLIWIGSLEESTREEGTYGEVIHEGE